MKSKFVVAFIFLNFLLLFLYLYFSSWIWAPEGEEAVSGGPGDPIIWTLSAFPMLMLGALFNVGWIVYIFFCKKDINRFNSLLLWLMVIVIWIVAYIYDGTRQFHG